MILNVNKLFLNVIAVNVSAETSEEIEIFNEIEQKCFLLTKWAMLINITQNLLSVADGAYNNISWYRLPPNQAKYVMLIVGRAQVPAYIINWFIVHWLKSSCVKKFLVF